MGAVRYPSERGYAKIGYLHIKEQIDYIISMAKLLIISKWLPYPLSDGGKQAIFNCIKALCNVHEVHLTYFEPFNVNSSEELVSEFKCECKGVYVHRFKEKKSKKELLKNKLYGIYRKFKNVTALDYMLQAETSLTIYPEEYLRYINNLIYEHKIQIVQVEMIANLTFVLSLPSNVKKIFVHHELKYVRNKLTFSNINLNLKQKNSIKLSKIMEISLLNQYDAIVTLSTTDKAKLIDEGVKCPIYSSFAIVTNRTKAINDNKEKLLLSFVGPETHMPNKDGLIWFLETCWNELLIYNPNMRLQIIGKWSSITQNEFHKKYNNIVFRGFVDDLTSTVQNSIMIVPILVGSGIRMKILESAQIGVPFVTTSVGVEGLPFVDGKDCFIADTSSEFIDKVKELSNNAELRNLMIANAGDLVNNNFSFEALKTNKLNIIDLIQSGC